VKLGSVRLALKFSQALQDTVTVIAYAEFENVIEIDRNGNVVLGDERDRTCAETCTR